MPDSGLIDAIEVLSLFTAFWRFFLSHNYRKQILSRWYSASPGRRLLLILQACVATVCGLVPVALIIIYGRNR